MLVNQVRTETGGEDKGERRVAETELIFCSKVRLSHAARRGGRARQTRPEWPGRPPGIRRHNSRSAIMQGRHNNISLSCSE